MPDNEKKWLGKIEYSDNLIVKGWALCVSTPDEPVTLEVLDGENLIDEITPSVFRWDLKQQGYGRGYHGFIYKLPQELLDGRPHKITFRFSNGGVELSGSPVSINHDIVSEFTPVKSTNLTGNKTLVIAPGMGDEIKGQGGSVALHIENSDQVKVLFLTGVNMDDARKACDILGVDDMETLGESAIELKADKKNIDKLSALLTEYKPGIIYCPSPHEFQPGHRAAADLLWRAVQKSGVSCRVAFSEINTAIRVSTLVDISAVIDKKKAACEVYNDQKGNRINTDAVLGLNRFRSLTIPDGSKYAEGFYVIDSNEILAGPIEKFSQDQFYSATGASKSNELPLVSVIVRTKDRPVLLEQALSSIAAQNYPNIEIVLVNDGNSDLSGIFEQFQNYIDIQYINPDKPFGRTKAGNEGLKAAKGKYVNFLDDDDLFYTNHISKLALYLDRTAQKAAYSDCEVGHYKWEDEKFLLKGEKELFRGVEHDLDQLMTSNYLPNMVLMFEREVLQEIGYPDEDLKIYEDWDLWIKLSLKYPPERIPGVTAEYRMFSDHNYDHSEWRMKLLQKYEHYYEGEELDASLLNRVDKLTDENNYLRKRLAESNAQFGGDGHSFSGSNTIWKLKYTIKQILPKSVVDYLKSKNFKL